MTDDDRATAETEERLRRALAARADAVEPATGTEAVPALARRADAARRRAVQQRTLLSVAAATVVVAGIALGLTLAGGDGGDLDVAGTTTLPGTSTTAGGTVPLDPAFEGPAIWPLPAMSIAYDSPAAAAEGFWTGYLGRPSPGRCGELPSSIDGERAVAGICGFDGQQVLLRDEGARGWVVVGAETDAFDLASPVAGSAHSGAFPVGLSTPVPVDVTVRAHGTIQVAAAGRFGPGDVDADLGPDDGADGTYVVAAVAETGATVRVARLTGPAPTTVTTAPTSTTSTTAPTSTTLGDTGHPGWPVGDVARFPDRTTGGRDAALAFAAEVLGFARPTVVPGGPGIVVVPRPTAGATTTIDVRFTGARGWVVVGATSSQGRIDEVEGRTVRGVATAFEATVVVRLLALDGTVLDTAFTEAGANGELAAFEAELDVDRPAEPHLVLVGEGDASGEGDLTWAAVTLLDP